MILMVDESRSQVERDHGVRRRCRTVYDVQVYFYESNKESATSTTYLSLLDQYF